LRTGNTSVKPGTTEAINNVYSSNGVTICGLTRPVIYKPNNYKFAQQGAVSSTSLITRKKFENINTIASTYNKNYNTTSNILSYKVPFIDYSIKDKIGYPTKKTPIISKNGLIKEDCYYRTKK
jgi:hypothetical protein